MNAQEIRNIATAALEDMKGQDLVCLDVGDISSFADYMLVVTGTSNRHVRSLAGEVVKKAKEAGMPAPKTEGEEQAEWVLIDLGDVIVHVMQGDMRRLYDLESLWAVGNSKPKE